jgi:dimethylhistidine N-methyltransferase
MAAEVLAGLRSDPKQVPCKYLYDERGSQLFEDITRLPEYYPTDTEISILERQAADMAEHLGRRCLLIEFGSGSSLKTRILLDELVEPAGYVPIDISQEHLLASAAELHARYPDLEILPVSADYMQEVEIPVTRIEPARRDVFFPGGTIGNFHRDEAVDFLQRKAQLVGAGGGLLLGVDLKKDPAVLERAYDDSQGVTARFDLNLLARLNRELDADFDLDRFRHRASWNETYGRVEMHLDSLADQVVRVAGEEIRFRDGESIWTESSYKYRIDDFHALAAEAGFVPDSVWTDDRDLFSVHLLIVDPSASGP